MFARPLSRLPRRLLTGLAAVALLLAAVVAPSAAAHPRTHPKPTVVLVHGAFADASGFNDVTANLQKRGYTVFAPANPLRGLAGDAEYLRVFLSTIPGPIVLVGHSYGGAVITNAATGNPNVKALVYVAAYALDEGETVDAANTLGGGPPSLLLSHIVPRPYPGSGEQDADVTIDPAWFRQVFAADLPARQAAVMASSQRPATYSSLLGPSGVPAWKTIPSWYLVATRDNAIPPAAERAMAKRAGASTVEVKSSHVIMTSHPKLTTNVIIEASNSTR